MGTIHLWSPFRWHHQRKGLTPTDTTSYSAGPGAAAVVTASSDEGMCLPFVVGWTRVTVGG
jgi:hypothetical protein